MNNFDFETQKSEIILFESPKSYSQSEQSDENIADLTTGINSSFSCAKFYSATNKNGPYKNFDQTPDLYICGGCQKPIRDKYLLKAESKFWHEDCLKCSCCECRLGEVGSTFYLKSNLYLCKRDYLRLFGNSGFCSVCQKVIPPFEMVMKAKTNVYHLECFACQNCKHRFCVGDKFYLVQNRILCESDYKNATITNNMTTNNLINRSESNYNNNTNNSNTLQYSNSINLQHPYNFQFPFSSYYDQINAFEKQKVYANTSKSSTTTINKMPEQNKHNEEESSPGRLSNLAQNQINANEHLPQSSTTSNGIAYRMAAQNETNNMSESLVKPSTTKQHNLISDGVNQSEVASVIQNGTVITDQIETSTLINNTKLYPSNCINRSSVSNSEINYENLNHNKISRYTSLDHATNVEKKLAKKAKLKCSQSIDSDNDLDDSIYKATNDCDDNPIISASEKIPLIHGENVCSYVQT